MGLDNKVSLADWLEKISKDPELGVLTAVKTHHWIQHGGGFVQGDEVDGLTFQQDKAFDPKSTAARIRGKCKTFCQGLPGTQTFKLFAYFGSEEAKATHHITEEGRLTAEGGLTEPPTAQGVTGQVQRWGEIVVSSAFRKDVELWGVAKYMMEKLEADRNFHAQESREAQGIAMQLMREKAMDMHAQRMKELEFERATAERKKIFDLLPAILRIIFKDKGFISEGMADTAVMEALTREVRKLSAEGNGEENKLMAMIPPSIMMVLGERMAEIKEKQEREEKAIAMIAQARAAESKSSDAELAGSVIEMMTGGAAPRLNS